MTITGPHGLLSLLATALDDVALVHFVGSTMSRKFFIFFLLGASLAMACLLTWACFAAQSPPELKKFGLRFLLHDPRLSFLDSMISVCVSRDVDAPPFVARSTVVLSLGFLRISGGASALLMLHFIVGFFSRLVCAVTLPRTSACTFFSDLACFS